MNFSEFSKIVKSEDIGGAYLLHGSEEYIKDLAVKTIIDKFIPSGMEAVNYDKIDASDGEAEKIENAMLPLPLMSQKRVVTVYNLELFGMTAAQLKQSQNQKMLEEIERLIKRCPKETILLFVSRGSASAGSAKPFSNAQKDVDFKKPDEKQKMQYMRKMASDAGLNIPVQLLSFLSDYTGMELLELEGEIKKLKAYCCDNEAQREDVMAVCSAAVEYSIFKMLKDISAGNGAMALAEYRKLTLSGQSPQAVIAMIEKQFRALFYSRELSGLDAQSLKTAANKLETKDFVIRNMQKTAARLNKDKIANIVQWCADADYLVKSGKITVDSSAEMLIMKLIGA